MKTIVVVLPLLIAGSAAAQTAAHVNSPSPLDAGVKVPATEFRSAFEGYKPFAEQAPVDWRKANDEVGRVGGHAGLHKSEPPKPTPAKGESGAGAAEKGRKGPMHHGHKAPMRHGHGGHK